MSNQELELRVKSLEEQVAEMKNLLELNRETKPWWEKITGSFEHSQAFDLAMKLGQEYRHGEQNNYDQE